MSKVQLLEIRYENHQNNVYLAGQQVMGRVNLILNEPMKIRGIRVKINGLAHTEWTQARTQSYTLNGQTHTQTYYDMYSASEEYFDTVFTVFGKAEGVSGDDPTLDAGSYNYPFVYQLPMNCPSSFESFNGHIRYTTKAVIDIPSRFDVKCTVPFTVVGIVDLNREPAAQVPFHSEQSKQLCCWCCIGGHVECHVNLPRSGFVPGETIPLNFEVHNKSNSSVKPVTVTFVEVVVFHARGGGSRKSEREICQLSGPEIASGNTDSWEGKGMLIPPIAPTIKTCSIIIVEYELRIEADPSGCHRALTVKVPILIGNVPLLSSYQPLSLPPAITSQPKPSAPPMQGAAGSMEPSAPPAYGMYPDLPPPTYTESVLEGGQIKGDDEHDTCPSNFKPYYPYFDYLSKQ